MASLVSIGQPVGHIEGPDKVTGHARYAADIALPGMLWGRCLRSPFPHARLVSIDVSRAKQLPGVHAVITGTDIPQILLGRTIQDMPVLARDRVRFVGEKVAALAAESLDIAEEALALIEVEYEELPAVFDPAEAMQEGAPRVHHDPASYKGAPQGIPPVPNVVSRVFHSHGDLEAGFAQADRIFEHTFFVPSVHQGYIEPHACVMQIEPDGKINCWLSNKRPFTSRSALAAALGVPEDRIRIVLVPLGGDFGGKGSLFDEVICYYLTERTGRPVKMVMTYTEELMAGNPRHSAALTLRSGVTKEGRVTARQSKVVFNIGAYGCYNPSPTVNLHGVTATGGLYQVANVEIESLCVYTNTVPRGNVRAPGAPQAVFAQESHMDIMAQELGLDPLEFRLRNSPEEGHLSPLAGRLRDIHGKQTLLAAARAAGWDTEMAPNVGRGVSMYDRRPGGGLSNAILSIEADGQLTLLTAVPDTGTGSHTILQQIVAQELEVPLATVAVVAGDTDRAAYEPGVGGSRTTHAHGQATLAAAREVKQALSELAGRLLGCSLEQVQLRGGGAVADDGRSLSLADLMARAAELGEAPIIRTGNYSPSGPADVTSFCVQIAEVEVDPETGRVKLRKLVSAHDVGTIINPLTHQGQVEGGVIQGMGQALTEHLLVEDGAVTALNLGDYKLPNVADIPEMETVLLESKSGPAPYEGKAIGEIANVAIPAAIANAVFDAVGVRLTELPITAERIYTALRTKEGRP